MPPGHVGCAWEMSTEQQGSFGRLERVGSCDFMQMLEQMAMRGKEGLLPYSARGFVRQLAMACLLVIWSRS